MLDFGDRTRNGISKLTSLLCLPECDHCQILIPWPVHRLVHEVTRHMFGESGLDPLWLLVNVERS